MNTYEDILLQSPLFKDIKKDDLHHLIICLKAYEKDFKCGEYVFSLGDEVNYIGIVLSGYVELVKETIAGNRTIIAFLGPSHIFAEGIVCTSRRISPISVRIREDAKILFIPYEHVIRSCGNACSFHVHLIHNMLRILGDKNYALNIKLDLLMLKGIQEKLITYLLSESKCNNNTSFNIVPNRTELAEFLNVSRTSMCRELAVLKAENLLDYYKNSFKLLDIPGLKAKLLR